ncbi:hypothetical protein ABZ281_43105 [Streptomyces sp. NPDC006265]|uniref:hypothetical protein n=1 Tax=Streptomyces sp. NPDC006265 TaxID=3156740 RepID=UPI0033BD4CED
MALLFRGRRRLMLLSLSSGLEPVAVGVGEVVVPSRTPPPPPTPAERAEAARRERLARKTAEREQRFAHERRQWGGRLPSDALRTVDGNVSGLRGFDPALLHALDAAGPATQRAVARFAARLACEAAGLTALHWVAHALTALAEDRPLPPPFDDDARMWHALASDPAVSDRTGP